MIVPRAPRTPTSTAFSSVGPPLVVAETALDLITEVESSVAAGADRHALAALTNLRDERLVARLSATAERRLAEMGENPQASIDARALAWTIYARSREIHCDLEDAENAIHRAYALSPTPQVLERLVGLTYRREGSIKALKLVDDGIHRWPDAESIKVMSAALRVGPTTIDEVGPLINDALAADPRNAYAMAACARMALFLDDPAAAIPMARGAIPEHPSLGRALLAVALHMSGRVNEDPALLVSVLADPPGDPWLLIKLAEALHATGRLSEALELLDRAEQLSPEDPLISRSRGFTNMVLGRYAEAASDFERARKAGTNTWLLAMLGEAARMTGDAASAIEYFMSIEPGFEPLWVPTSLGLAQLSLGELTAANDSFTRALDRTPDDVNALCGLVEVALDRDDAESLKAAEHLVGRALAVDPKSAKAQALSGEVLRRTGRRDEAITAFDRALELNPNYSYALASKGQTLIDMDHRAEGFELMIGALQLAPDLTWIREDIYHRLVSDDRESYDVADGLLRSAQLVIKDTNQDQLSITVMRARLARLRGRAPQAARLYRKACARAPEDAQLALEAAATLQGVGRGEEALGVLERTMRSAPGGSELVWKRIELLWDLNRLVEAREALEHLVESPDPAPSAWAALGEIYRLDGDRRRARELLERALDRLPDDPNTLASLGALDLEDGDVEAARERLHTAVRLRPGYGFALDVLVRLELDAGRTDQVGALIDAVMEPDPTDRPLTAARVAALYGLGDYEGAIDAIDDCMAVTGDDPSLLRARGWVEIGLMKPHQARRSFQAAAELPGSDSEIVDMAVSLVRVDLWATALSLAAKAAADGNRFAPTALAVVWLAGGFWDRAATDAARGIELAPNDRASARYAIRSYRRNGSTTRALSCARAAIARWPQDQALRSELAYSLAAAGDLEGAHAAFEVLLTGIRNQAFRDADHFVEEGRCLLSLDRAASAVQALLRALSATDRPAVVLLDLVRASLLVGDVAQAAALEERVTREIDQLSAPGRHGLIAAELHHLSAIAPRLGPIERVAADRIAADLTFRQARVRPEVLRVVSMATTG